ncbi:MAG: hypothetical protein M1814_006895 [Vezdaea aestivalis]|nr:MAG: hypothetical protein M1814_006895 [Vezdaea aestivalis]
MDDPEVTDDPKAPIDRENEKDINNDIDAEEPEDMSIAVAEVDEAEAVRKRGALDNLGSIERLFAAFRDRLYDDRLTQLNNELALLENPDTIHPEYLAQLQCIDARRADKIHLEGVALRCSLEALERTSVATRAQIQSQCFQTLRKSREDHLDRIAQEFHDIQADRRTSESGIAGMIDRLHMSCTQLIQAMVDYVLRFPSSRSEQISHQAAYNKEVSVLAGFAKYTGYPAAPEVAAMSTSEVDEDLQKIGIKPQSAPTTTSRPGSTRNSILLGANHRKPAAEEQFLEQTPWANPQHPIHQQRLQQTHQQVEEVTSSSATAGPSKGKRKLPFDDGSRLVTKTAVRQISGPVKGRFSPKIHANSDPSSKGQSDDVTIQRKASETKESPLSPHAVIRTQSSPPLNHQIATLETKGDGIANGGDADGVSIFRTQGPQSVTAGGNGHFT